MYQSRLPQPLQLPARNLRPLPRAVQLQIGLPMMHGLQILAGPLAQESQIEMRIGILGIERQRLAIMKQRFAHAILLIVEVAQRSEERRVGKERRAGREWRAE